MIPPTALRVLHIVPSRPFGGMQRIAVDLAAEQRREGIDARVLSIYRDPHFEHEITEKGVPHRATRGGRWNGLGYVDFINTIATCRPTLVHLHGGLLWANVLGLAVKRCPWILHVHVFWNESLTRKNRLNERVTLELCDAVISVSRAVTRSLSASIARSGLPTVTIYNGTSIANGLAQREAHDLLRPHFGMATRFAPEKGVEEFVDACAAIARNHSGARFTLAGNGPLLEPARRRAHALGLTDRLSFPGFVRDMPTFWRSLDVAIFTTPKEPFGLRIIEPMTCGTPVVAYRTGFGSDELIEDRVTGHLIDTFGDAEAMAARCLDAVRDTKQWTAMSQAGRSKVRTEFSLERMARSINELYADVLRSAPPFEASNT